MPRPKLSDSKPCRECKGPITRRAVMRQGSKDVTAFARRTFCHDRCRLKFQKRNRQILGR